MLRMRFCLARPQVNSGVNLHQTSAIMKALFHMLLVPMALSLGALACEATRGTVVRSGPPYTQGSITAVDAVRGFLVAGQSGTSSPPQTWVRLTPSTDLFWADDRQASTTDLAIGRFVEVWGGAPAVDSVPPQIVAVAIRVFVQPLP
jgi:hypothetical protein